MRDDDCVVVSEPFSDLPGAWVEIPESTVLIVHPDGEQEQRPFARRARRDVGLNHAAIAVAVDGLIAPGPQPPPTVADLAASVQALGLPHGIERSLMAKLGGAQRKLDAGHDAAACNTLGAILNEVNAHKIGPGDAAALSADARAVRDSLGCGSS